MPTFTLLDGPVGTELAARGVPTPAPLWSAAALETAPAVVSQIHRDYAAAGATVHTAATFRTQRRAAPERWEELLRRAVALTRAAVPAGNRIAGSMAPLGDCYRPEESPADPRPEHRELARALAAAGADLLLCETFPHVGEALCAVEEAVATGLDTWVSFTAGPDANLLTPREVEHGAREAVRRGARAVLVNCIPADRTLPYVAVLAGLGVPFGAYANAGPPGNDWDGAPRAPTQGAPTPSSRPAGSRRENVDGSCCGTGPEHIQAVAELARAGGDGRR